MKLWIRVDVAIGSDPNVFELAQRLNISFAEAVGMCVLVWGKIAEHRPSGDISGITNTQLEQWASFRSGRGKPRGSFGAAFLDLFTSDGEASGWHDRQGALIERAEKERTRKRRGKSAEVPRKVAATERNGTERDATVRNEESIESVAERESISAGSPPASLVEQLPAEARAWLTLFYEFPAMNDDQRERYRKVAIQLVDALDPRHPGPKIRGGRRVKARSKEHLADVCKAVMRDPPIDRDMAIVFVLKKLLDPPKGPSESEVRAQDEAVARKEVDLYYDEARVAAIVWSKSHPTEYQPILAEVDAHYRGRSGMVVDMARTAELTTKCSKAAGFPTFEEWRDDRNSPLEMPA
jgi:hypothetical protein